MHPVPSRTRRAAIFFVAVPLLLSGCVAKAEPEPQRSDIPVSTPAQEEISIEPDQMEPNAPENRPRVYTPPEEGLTAEETVLVYLEQLYQSYISFEEIDLSAILDTRHDAVQGSVLWTRMLNQRRRILWEEALCYVETERFPYRVRFLSPEELEDQRLEDWDPEALTRQGEVLLHFTVEGEAGRAYPPQLAVNTQHTMRLQKQKGTWTILFHYYPSALTKYLRLDLREYTDEEMRQMLLAEFASHPEPDEDAPSAPKGAARYDGEAAAAYALRYAETYNPHFYRINDWLGDCANFTSQCIWAGFGGESDFSRMTDIWYAGEGGGSPVWENVVQFWNVATESSRFGGLQYRNVADAVEGDLIQTAGWSDKSSGGRFIYTHSLLLVDRDTLLLAQHSPTNLVYYADLVDASPRFLRPVYLME